MFGESGSGTEGLLSLLGQIGKSAPSIFNSLTAGQTASNPYLQNYNQSLQQQPLQQQNQQQNLNAFIPQQNNQYPQESFIPQQQYGNYPVMSLFNRNRLMSGGQQTNPMQDQVILG